MWNQECMDSDMQQILAVQHQISLGHHNLLDIFRVAAWPALHAPQNDSFPVAE